MKDWQRTLGAVVMSVAGLCLCKFTLFQSLLLGLFGLAFWELRDIKFVLDAKSEQEESR